jgi:diguanylate cyclase (GGDEF)-like protein/putative nucleotidyltransferase with HDIG domain
LSLRAKIYLIVGATLLVAVVVVFLVSQTVFMRGFESVESSEAQDQIKRAQAAVAWNVMELGIAVKGYRSDVDVLEFLQSRNPANVESELGESFFAGVKANALAICDKDGNLLWGRGFDLGKAEFTALPPGLESYLAPQGGLTRRFLAGQDISGILMLSGAPMLVNSQPLFASGSKTVEGSIIIGRWMDTAVLAEVGASTRLDLSVAGTTSTDLPQQVKDALAAAGTAASIAATGSSLGSAPAATVTAPSTFVLPSDADTLIGYSLLRDVFGQSALVLKVHMPRAVYAQGASSVRYFTLSLAALVIVFGIVLNQLLERSLFRRLAGITAQVRHIKPGKARLDPIQTGSRDELGLLAETINAGFSQLEETRTQQEIQARNLSSTLQELSGRHEDLEKSHIRLQQLQHVSASLGSSLDIREALVQLEAVALDIFEADEIWLLKLRPNQDQLAGLGAFFKQKPGYARLPRLFGCERPEAALPEQLNTLLKTVAKGSDAIFIGSVSGMSKDEQRRLFGATFPDLAGFESLALVPLVADDSCLGLAISASTLAGEFKADRRSTILLFAGQLAQALKNTRLVEEIKALGEVDALSGLYNRRRALEQLEMELKRAQRYEGRFSLMIADVDNFKLFNDTYGHPLGDEIIKRVANILLHRARSSDFVARFGGDEFLLILPEAYRADAKKVADSMRTALSMSPYIAPDGARIPLRMSFGASSFPEDGRDVAALIAVADANLYESKRWGGDTVTVRPEPVSSDAVDSRAFSTLDSLVSAVDNKDHYTRRHSAQVAEYSAQIGKVLGLSNEQLEALQVAALLHDVGKIGVPDRILRKPGSLTTKELEYMRQHPLIGSMMIMQHLPESLEVKDAVAAHHERWDGKGYPAQLLGRQIPLLARIMAVADSYSAMTTDRPYHAALESQEALDKIVEASGTQFDPDMVKGFMAVMAPAPQSTIGAA